MSGFFVYDEATQGFGVINRYGLEDLTSSIEDNNSIAGDVSLLICELTTEWRKAQGDSQPGAGRPN